MVVRANEAHHRDVNHFASVAANFLAKSIPCSAIWIDSLILITVHGCFSFV
uniref:Uncharacterized protein n=1 Tax=Lotus japonicus TaxID=34305 RepID=I3S0V7_LOTJA|nr:unknown [Lotus japonicus]